MRHRICLARLRSCLALCLILSCTTTWARDPVVEITLLHLNDVYEILPVSGGGGLARVAQFRKDLLEQNPNTFTVLAGDLLSPSALGLAMVDGERLAGRQIVAVMNHLGLDYTTFGNHEFDLAESQFRQRLKESDFQWFSSNVFDVNGQAFRLDAHRRVPPNIVFTVRDNLNNQARIGLFGLTLDSNQAPYVRYTDPLAAAARQVKDLRDRVDILVAVTHQSMEDDVKLAREVRGIDLILGGHEHEHMQARSGPDATPIFKADANALSVYVHDLAYNTATRQLQIHSRLQKITAEIRRDAAVDSVVHYWKKKAFAGFRAQGFCPDCPVVECPDTLDGREARVRNGPTNLTEIVAAGMLSASPGTKLAIFNSGSIRIDDQLAPGRITQYDVIRIMPFGGAVLSVQMRGADLERVLDAGAASKGSGAYLQTANTVPDGAQWRIDGEKLDPDTSYQVAMNDFLLTGKEKFRVPEAEKAYLDSLGKHLHVIKGSIQFNIASEFNSKTLDERKISDALRQAFAENGIPLSQQVTVSVNKKDNQWLIEDTAEKKTYFIKKYRYKLIVYAANVDMRQALIQQLQKEYPEK